ncbi:MAG: MBL fold metallo-hydrolase, partial [Elusimicrobia bacterium]|nr:MBL fold metallo-hydrolase [Elusimicrobiota bacterium]
MIIESAQIGKMANYCYIAGDGKRFAVIDPGWDAQLLIEKISKAGTLDAVMLTHGHFDHVRAADEIARHFNVPIYIHGGDLELSQLNVAPAIIVGDKFKLKIGVVEFEFIHTPGHTQGSCCILAEDNLFTGDTLFINECGRVDLPGSDAGQMYESLL